MNILGCTFVLAHLLLASGIRCTTAAAEPQSHRREDHRYLPKRLGGITKETVFMVAIVTSPGTRPDRRSWQQWARNVALLQEPISGAAAAPAIVMKFAVGGGDVTADTMAMLSAEEAQHGDILILDSVADLDDDNTINSWHTTSATTEKVLYAIQWAARNYHFQYFARLGDDSYFRPDEFFRAASAGQFPATMAVIGRFLGPYGYATAVGQNSVMFPAGMGFVLTFDVAAWISTSAGMLTAGFPEDVVVGSWLAGTKVVYINEVERFHDGDIGASTYRPCSDRDILIHHMRLEADWQRIDASGVMQC